MHYIVHSHYSKRQAQYGPNKERTWVVDPLYNVWKVIGEFRSRPKAIEAAKAENRRTVVWDDKTSQTIFDNGCEPEPVSPEEYKSLGGY